MSSTRRPRTRKTSRDRIREHLRQSQDDWLGTGSHRERWPLMRRLEGVSVIARGARLRLSRLGEDAGDRGDLLFLRAGRGLEARGS